MMFSWFDARDSVAMGIKLAIDLTAALMKVRQGSKKEEESRLKAINHVFSQLVEFKKHRKLNFYKKAKLVNAFKWHLLELGHDKDEVDALTKQLLFHV